MQLPRFNRFRSRRQPQTVDGITCSLGELLELRHAAKGLSLGRGRSASSVLAGNTLSRFRGRGMDYAETRLYSPGDDIRSLDWRVTARTGKAHTKLFAEERDRPVILLIDFSPSLYFGSREAFKSVIAARLAATIAWTAVYNGDRVGALLKTPRGKLELRPKAGRRGVLSLLHTLVDASRLPENPPENLAEASGLDDLVHNALRALRPGSRIFLISDFYRLEEAGEANLNRLKRHNDLILCQLLDPLEIKPPATGVYRFTNGRRQLQLDCNDPGIRQSYSEKLARRQQQTKKLSQRLGCPLIRLVSGEDISGGIRRGLSFREAGR